MKKRINLIIMILICRIGIFSLAAQTLHIESMATIHIEDAAAVDGTAQNSPTLFVQGDIQNDGTIQNNGELQLTGNITNNGNYASTGDDVFAGSGTQTISGDFTLGNAFHNLILDKSGTYLNALTDVDIDEAIYLTNGVLVPNSQIIHLKNTSGNAIHSNAPSGSANNFIAGTLRHDITIGQTYTFPIGDLVHGNQRASLFFNDPGGATLLDINYNSDSAGIANIAGCGGLYNSQTGIWTITANGTNGTYDYDVMLDPGGVNLAAISSGIYDGSLKDGVFITDPCANTLGNFAANNLNSFSQFKIAAGTNTALPVTITSFTGHQVSLGDQLEWTTSSEQNNAYFNLQHSTDAVNYTTIAKVNSKAPNGNSAAILMYTCINTNPIVGQNYYRLEQTDIDGNKKIHPQIVRLGRNETNTTINIYPNPVKDILHVEFYADDTTTTTVKIFDMSGRLIKLVMANSKAGRNAIDIDLSELPNALYSVQLFADDIFLSVNKISKHD